VVTRLSLRRESLTALTDDELGAVAGGSHLCEVTHGASFDESCPTVPVNACVRVIYETLLTSACG
jgi:hypothetical protein